MQEIALGLSIALSVLMMLLVARIAASTAATRDEAARMRDRLDHILHHLASRK